MRNCPSEQDITSVAFMRHWLPGLFAEKGTDRREKKFYREGHQIPNNKPEMEALAMLIDICI